jgi:hypothetical protein
VLRGLSEPEYRLLGKLMFLLPLPVRRKRLGLAPLARRLVPPSPEALFTWT